MIAPDHVRLAYRLFLGREPSRQELETRPAAASPRELTRQLLASGEFAAREGVFRPYVIPMEIAGCEAFDFLIADALAEAWYAGYAHGDGGRELDWCLARLKPGMTVLDCGAHHGLFATAFAKAVAPRGRLIAWEAWPTAAAVAEWNMALNGCDHARIRPVALGCSGAGARFFVNDETVFASAGADLPSATLPTVSLDDDLPAGTRVDFLKIDVEGSELDVLRGASKTLSQRPILNLEVHNFLDVDREASISEIAAILKPLGYRYWLQEEPDFGEVRLLGPQLDLRALAQAENPHLFCEPQ